MPAKSPLPRLVKLHPSVRPESAVVCRARLPSRAMDGESGRGGNLNAAGYRFNQVPILAPFPKGSFWRVAFCLAWSHVASMRIAFVLLAAMVAYATLPTPSVLGQVNTIERTTVGFPVFPRAEYYLARELLRDGNTIGAVDGFTTAIRLGSQVNNQRGIDAVPSMVMLGECYYQQGNLAAALEQFDAALELSISQSAWINAVQPLPPAAEFVPPLTKGINWYTSVRNTRLPAFSNRWPIVLTFPGLLLTTPSGIVLPVNEIYTIDALEVLRVQALALRRRWMILGPIAPKLPFTQTVSAAFGPPSPSLSPPIEAGLAVCQAYALLANGESAQAEKVFRSYVSLQGALDHDLTPLALMGLADMACNKNDFKMGSQLLLESTIVSARLIQHDLIAEAIGKLSAIASSQRDATSVPMFRQIAQWAKGRSALLIFQSMAGLLETHIALGDMATARAILQEAAPVRTARDIFLPRIESSFLYSNAQLAATDRDVASAQKMAEQAIAMLTNPTPQSSASHRIYQLRLWEKLFRNGQFDRQTAAGLMNLVLAESTDLDWQLAPLDCLAWQCLDKLSAYDIGIASLLRRKDPKLISLLVDQSQRHLYHLATPLGGRLQSTRMLFYADRSLLPSNAAKDIVKLKGDYPEIVRGSKSFEQMLAAIRAAPIEMQPSRWPEDMESTWNQAAALQSAQEAMIWQVALSRNNLPQAYPPPVDLDWIKNELQEGDVAFVLFPSENNFHGVLISRTGMKYWQSISIEKYTTLLQKLLNQMGIFDKDPQANPAWNKKEWETTAAEICQAMFPNDVQKELASSKRLFIVPTGKAWYLPFEVLPLDANKGPTPWLSSRRVVYVPTLGLIQRCLASTPVQPTRLLVVSDKRFFSSDEPQNRLFMDEIVGSAPVNYEVSVQDSKKKFQDSRGARFQPSQVVVAVRQNLDIPAAFSPFAYDQLSPGGKLAAWSSVPLGAPQEVILPGLSLAGGGTPGNDVFQLACSMMANGSRSILISRWPVGGASSKLAIRGYQRELEFSPASEAIQRSLFDLWATDLDAANEPVLDYKPGSPKIVKGSQAIFWATYMQIGDTNPAKP
jgi:tetratricopeptide (TPR) repeat protein